MILIIKASHLEEIIICFFKLNYKHREETIYFRKNLICVIFGELETQTRSVILFVSNTFIISTLENLKNEDITDEHSVCEYLKYKIRKFSKNFSKEAADSKKLNLQL